MHRIFSVAALAALALPRAFAEGETQPADATCGATHGAPLAGVVRDSTQALVPGASLTLDSGQVITSGNDGRFRFPCVSAGTHTLALRAEGFAPDTVQLKLPHAGDVVFVLKPDTVQIGVDVNADETVVPDTQGTGASQTISGKQLQALADDPDDLQRELQQLGAASGGNPSNTTISVDGFQDSSKLPPKSSIAYIKVNPDMYSAEYREPPFDGGRVEVYTKPGQSAFHGALFATNGSPWMNARDPFSPSRASLGKQRYGFELTGPIVKNADFSVDLEHRSIDNFAVVNAVTLNSSGDLVNTVVNVPTPQRLWVGEARVDWQLGAKNTFISSYSVNMNSLQNLGVGGTNLAEAGYNSGTAEHTLRFTDITTLSAHLMHEARFSLRWNNETDVPTSVAPQVQVSGAFTGGGATLGNQRDHDLRTEIDDDAILTTGKHTLKFGTEMIIFHANEQLTTGFNGTYTFGGGVAPVLNSNGVPVGSETETITGIQQFQRAQLGQPGGAPTAFTGVAGSPAVGFTQVRDALFVQDDWNVGKGVHLSTGLRYFWQTNPLTLSGFTPRAGILWSPTKKGTWTLHAHAGLFATQIQGDDWAEIVREDGTARTTNTVYNPTTYCAVAGLNGCSPLAGGTAIASARNVAGHLTNGSYAIENIGGTRALPGGWNLSLDYYVGRLWNIARTENVNSPVNGVPTGPRPLASNLNLLQVQNSGQGRANVTFAGIEQHSLKRVQLFFGGVRVNLVDNTDDSTFSTPQSSFTEAGEFAHRSNQPLWNLFGNASFTVPEKFILSGNFHGGGDAHYNIVTGFDNNGDGNFNDRPQIAAPGTPGALQTHYGLLVATGGEGVLQRNLGVMPWQFYLDTNIQRAFTLTRNAKADHQQVLTVNVRSSNVLNHTNVTSVGGVFASPLFGVPYQADNGRRIEGGLRYSF